jgi:hypothetical protein
MSAQYSESMAGSSNSSDYNTLNSYYDFRPLVATGIPTIALQASAAPYLNLNRSENMYSNSNYSNGKVFQVPFRSGYDTLSGYNSNNGNGSNYFSLDNAYKTR